jgi:riboflavin synthase alpha subunit
VNLEVDIVARYLERLLAARAGETPAGAPVRSEAS